MEAQSGETTTGILANGGALKLLYYTNDIDLTVVNAARASFRQKSETLSARDIRLIEFLARNGHSSPFRHASLTFQISAPLMVARQWWKYVVGSEHGHGTAWNEGSNRYIREGFTFYLPDKWRGIPENRKQGSSGFIAADEWTAKVAKHYEDSLALYNEGVDDFGVAPEQARLVLPANAQYTNWVWTASPAAVAHFLNQRMADDAQWEIRKYAHEVYRVFKMVAPYTCEALVERKADE